MRKVISIFLSSIIAVICCFSSPVFSADAAVASGQCGASNVYWSYKDGVITFTGTGRAMGYNANTQPYKQYFENITKAVFSEGITGVASGALNGAINITEVVLPSTVTEICGSAFYGCSKLQTLDVPGVLTSIGDQAFYQSGLKNLTINPESRYTIGNYAFNGTGITEIPYGAISVGEYAFNNCQGIRSMTIPETVEALGEYAMRNCISLKWIKIPENCTSIAQSALYNSLNQNLNVVIIAPYKSYAHTYAKENRFKYEFSDEHGEDWFYADFEEKDISVITAENAEISRINSDAYEGSGAVAVSGNGGVGRKVALKKGVTYRISAMLKISGATDRLASFFIKKGNIKESVPIDTTLKQNEWVCAEAEIVGSCDYVGIDAGCESYLVDNFFVIPIYDDVRCEYSIEDSGVVEFSINSSTPQNGYYYEISSEGNILAAGTTRNSKVSYMPTEDDVGKNLKFAGTVLEDYERLLEICECETKKIEKAADVTAECVDEKLTERSICESFTSAEVLEGYQTFGSPTISFTDGVSTGAAEVTVNSKYDSLKFDFFPVLGETYEISMWVKQTSGKEMSGAKLFFETSDKNDGKYLYEIVENLKTPIPSGKWTKVTFTYYHDGKAVLTGTGGTLYDSINRVDMSIRLSEDTGFSYLLDDVRISPMSINSGVRFAGKNTVEESLILDCLSASECDGYIYTIRCDDAVIKSGFSKEGKIEVPLSADYEGKVLTAEVFGVFAGKISDSVTGKSKVIEGKKDYFAASFYSEIVAGNKLSGNIECENNTGIYEPMKFLALYAENEGRLVELKTLSDEEFDIESKNVFDKAKLFIWNNGSLEPLSNAAVIEKPQGDIVYVDCEKGDDGNDASFNKPLKTLKKAKEKVRELLPDAKNDIYVILKSGEYILDETLTFDNSDCKEDVNVIYVTDGKEQAVISGGKHIPPADWSLYDEEKNIYRAYVGKDIRTRQLYVNGIRAIRARSEINLVGLENGTYDDIGHTTTDESYLDFKYPKDLEMVYFRAWTNPRCLVDSIYEENGVVRIKMNEVGWTNLNNKLNANLHPNVPSYSENAYELLDEEREWYLNIHDGYLYYKPAVFEVMKYSDVVIPILEKLVTVSGNETDFAQNITFKNIGFKYATWLRPGTDIGHSDSQNNKIRDGVKVEYNDDGTYKMTIAYQDEHHPDAAVEVAYAENINFIDCTFSKLGSIGLKMVDGVKKFKLQGNQVYDISGNGICIGEPYRYYAPDTEDKYVIRDIEISNNVIYDVGEEFKSSGGLSVTFAKNCLIKNNEIFRVPYSGIHIGHTPTTYTQNLRIENNYVHDCLNEELSDGGGIYHSNATSGTEENPNIVSGNYVKDIMNNAWRIAFDNESSGYRVFNNVVDATRAKVMNEIAYNWAGLWEIYDVMGNYETVKYDNNYGTLGVVEHPTITNHHVSEFGEWSNEASAIIENAGLNSEYQRKFADIVRKVEHKESYTLYSGESADIERFLYVDKDSIYVGNEYVVYFTDINEHFIKITPDNRIQALGTGQTKFTMYFVFDDTLIKKTVNINVI